MAAQLLYFCYIEPQRLTLVGNAGVNVQLSLSGLIVDLEVVDRERIMSLVAQFLQSHSIAPGMVIFLLAPSLLFEQDLSTVPLQNKDNTIQRFLESVPFENVGSKPYMINTKERLVAANEELYSAIRRAFEQKGLQVSAVIPYNVVQASVPELASSVNPTIIFSKYESLKQYALGEAIMRPTTFERKTGLHGKRDMILLGVFGFLLLVLFYLIITSYLLPKQPTVLHSVQNSPKTLTFPTSAPHASGSAQQVLPSTGSAINGASR